MKELRGKKGITLVALIITIIVLLLLAVVAISAVTGDGIINYAKNAKSEYQAAQTNENTTLESYINVLNNYNNTTATSNLIQFTIDGETCYAEEGWDWATWIESDYNTINVYVEEFDNCIALNGQYVVDKENMATLNIESAPNIENGDVFVLYGNTPT